MLIGVNIVVGLFYSQSNEVWFFYILGLKIVYLVFLEDVKGFLVVFIEDLNLVMFFEYKFLYWSICVQVLDDYYMMEIGKVGYVCCGDDVIIIIYGLGVYWVMEVFDQYLEISVNFIDLKILLLLDIEIIFEVVCVIGKVIVFYEDCMIGGIGVEIVLFINEYCFNDFDVLVKCVVLFDILVLFVVLLECQFLFYDWFR